jgi:hypothetical protein
MPGELRWRVPAVTRQRSAPDLRAGRYKARLAEIMQISQRHITNITLPAVVARPAND